MCFYDIVVYKDCGHQKSESVTPCNHGSSTTKERCMVSVCENRVVDHGKQTYCRSCRCKIESEICKAGDQMLRDIDADIQVVLDFQVESEGKYLEQQIRCKDYPDILEMATLRYKEASADVLLWISERDEDILEARNWKALQLQEFRESQGVWDDDWVRVEPEVSKQLRSDASVCKLLLRQG